MQNLSLKQCFSSWEIPWHWVCWNARHVFWLWAGTGSGSRSLLPAHASLCASKRFTVFLISCVCLPHEAFETITQSEFVSLMCRWRELQLPQPRWSPGVCSVSQPDSEAGIIQKTQGCQDRKMEKTTFLCRKKRMKGFSWQEGLEGQYMAVGHNKEILFVDGVGDVFMILDRT